VLVVTTLFLGIVALAVPYVSELVKRRFYAPELLLEFDQTPPDCHITKLKTINLLGGIPYGEEPIYYFRFRVTNNGKSQAKRCEPVVERLSVADASGNFIPYKRYTPVSLIWGSSYPTEFVDINPKRRFYCDLFHIPNKKCQEKHSTVAYVNPPDGENFDLGIILNVKAAFYSQPNRLPPGRYKIDIAIYSENAKTILRSFVISWSGNWRENEENMFREIVVELIQ
ncbi:MAG: hypothetical protein Q7N50_02520, partial [Armatimonadota bacterium]|nr:hypothetical protein [Armatimonadota bacterium]